MTTSTDAPADVTATTGRTRAPAPRRRLVGLVGAAALLAGVLLGTAVERAGDPSPSAVDTGFAQDMQVHHRQAVEMALIAQRRTEQEDVRLLAYDIATTQQAQVGMMSEWLHEWDRPQVGSGPPMTWMPGEGTTMPLEDGRMPGMATDAELAALRVLPPDAMDEEFLRLMIDHHRGGVMMAQAAADAADVPRVARLAQKMVDGQAAEVGYMNGLLDEVAST